MRFIIKVLFTAFAVMLAAYLLSPHIQVDNFFIGVLVALTLALLNAVVRPILVFISIPATVLTLGLFIFVINAILILIAAKLFNTFDVKGFRVENFWWALLFSVIISFVSSVLNGFIKKDENHPPKQLDE